MPPLSQWSPQGRSATERSRAALLLITIAGLAPAAAAASGLAEPAETTLPKVECLTVPSKILGREVDTCVVMPAQSPNGRSARYPTLYYLHGLFEDDRSWIERGGEQVLEDLLGTREVRPFIVVLPDGGKTFYINSYDGRVRYEDFFIQELVPYIDRHYPTIPDRGARGVGGTSMGGYGALHLAMRHADVFGSASAQSAALFEKFPHPLPSEGRWGFYARILQEPFGSPLNEQYWEANNPLTLAERPSGFSDLKLYFDCGDHDRYGFEKGAEILDRILSEKTFPHEFFLRAGDHGWTYLNKYMKYALVFHWRYFSAAESRLSMLHAEKGGP